MSDERVQVKVMGVYAHQDEGVVASHFVLFRDNTRRRLPIFIGQFEAWAISLALEGPLPDRPFTHDAMLNCLAVAGATVEEACINDLRDEVFYAALTLRVGDERHEVDIRPRDAVALALRAKCPLFISEAVMQSAHRRE